MPQTAFMPASLGFRISYSYWAHIHRTHAAYVKHSPRDSGVFAFRQRVFELGIEKAAQGLSEEALHAANEHIKPQSKTITVSIGSVEINKKFQKIRQSTISKIVEEKAAAAIIFYAGLEELATRIKLPSEVLATKAGEVIVSESNKDRVQPGAHAPAKAKMLSVSEAKKFLAYSPVTQDKREILDEEELDRRFEKVGSRLKAARSLLSSLKA